MYVLKVLLYTRLSSNSILLKPNVSTIIFQSFPFKNYCTFCCIAVFSQYVTSYQLTFYPQLRDFDKEHISEKTLKKIAAYTSHDDFKPDIVGAVSTAAKSLCQWVIAIEKYAKIYK